MHGKIDGLTELLEKVLGLVLTLTLKSRRPLRKKRPPAVVGNKAVLFHSRLADQRARKGAPVRASAHELGPPPPDRARDEYCKVRGPPEAKKS